VELWVQVDNLRYIIEQTDAKIVLSTDWRRTVLPTAPPPKNCGAALCVQALLNPVRVDAHDTACCTTRGSTHPAVAWRHGLHRVRSDCLRSKPASHSPRTAVRYIAPHCERAPLPVRRLRDSRCFQREGFDERRLSRVPQLSLSLRPRRDGLGSSLKMSAHGAELAASAAFGASPPPCRLSECGGCGCCEQVDGHQHIHHEQPSADGDSQLGACAPIQLASASAMQLQRRSRGGCWFANTSGCSRFIRVRLLPAQISARDVTRPTLATLPRETELAPPAVRLHAPARAYT
jgi:hypothetical protein